MHPPCREIPIAPEHVTEPPPLDLARSPPTANTHKTRKVFRRQQVPCVRSHGTLLMPCGHGMDNDFEPSKYSREILHTADARGGKNGEQALETAEPTKQHVYRFEAALLWATPILAQRYRSALLRTTEILNLDTHHGGATKYRRSTCLIGVPQSDLVRTKTRLPTDAGSRCGKLETPDRRVSYRRQQADGTHPARVRTTRARAEAYQEWRDSDVVGGE